MMKSQKPNPKTQLPKRKTPLSHLGLGIWRLGFGILLCVAFTGCAKAKAKTVAEGPPLQVPEPPPRVLVPAEEPIAATPVTPDAPPAPAPRTPAPRPANPPRRPNTTTNDPEPRQEAPPPVAAQPAPATPPPATTTVEPPRELRPALSAADAAEERKIRDQLTRASRDLNRVDYRRLSADGKAQYEQSKRFSDQAEQAIKDRNYVFAATLADKAATLAAELLR